MKSKRNILIALVVILIALFVVVPAVRIQNMQGYYNNCGASADIKPTSITEYCADAGVGVSNIQWSSWTHSGATGTGNFYINSCDPNCASGKVYTTANAIVTLSAPKFTHKKKYFMDVTVTPPTGSKLAWPPKQGAVPTSVKWVTDTWRG